jgi:hypothetical protein
VNQNLFRGEPIKMPSQFVIPEAFLIGNPDSKTLKDWIPDKSIRG